MPYSVSHHKLTQILSAHGLKTGDAGGIDKLFGGNDGYYWFGTVRDLCPPGKTWCGRRSTTWSTPSRPTKTPPPPKTR